MRWMNIQERFRNRGMRITHIYTLVGSPMGFIPVFQVKQIKSDPLICTHFHVFSKGVCDGGPDDLDWDPPHPV